MSFNRNHGIHHILQESELCTAGVLGEYPAILFDREVPPRFLAEEGNRKMIRSITAMI